MRSCVGRQSTLSRGALVLLLVLVVSAASTAPLCGMACHEPASEPDPEPCHGSAPEPAGDGASCGVERVVSDSDCCCGRMVEKQPAIDRELPASPAPVIQPALQARLSVIVRAPHRSERSAPPAASPSGASRLDLLCSYLL